MRFVLGICVFAFALHLHARALLLDLPEQDLGGALEHLAQLAGVQLLYPSDAVAGLRGRALRGEYTLEAALDALLAGTGLRHRRTRGDAVAIETVGGARTLAAVRVTGAEVAMRRGANTSSDVLATENSGRYAPRGAGVGSPYPQSLKDTPRALSVVGLPQMRDQNIQELGDALRQLPAVTVESYRTESVGVTVRGRSLDLYQIDGGAPLSFLGERVFGDLAAYDRVEVLYGADGIGNGFAAPSGTLNLVRKRPLDHAQVVVETQTGRWDYWRGMLDASAAPVLDGRLRGRAVLAGIDREFFYEGGERRRGFYYGVTEADLAPGTLLRVGGSYLDERGSPWEGGGLPRFVDGEPVSSARNANWQPDWNYEDTRQREVFAALDQALGARWSTRLAVEYRREERPALVSETYGLADRDSGDGLLLVSTANEERNQNRLADLRINGRFRLWGREQIASFGYSHSERDKLRRFPSVEDYFAGFVFVDAYAYDRHAILPPVYANPLDVIDDERTRRYGGYMALTLRPLEPLGLIAAWRWSEWTYLSRQARTEAQPQRARERAHGLSYAGATWALTPDWNLYASWSDVLIVNTGVITPDGDHPDPVRGENLEAGLKYADADEDLQARLTLFRSTRRGFPRYIVPEQDDPGSVICCFANGGGGRDRAQGAELEITGRLDGAWQLVAGYTYTDLDYRYGPVPGEISGPDNDISGASLDRFTPRHVLRLWTLWEPRSGAISKLRFGAGLRAQSRALLRADDVVPYVNGPLAQQARSLVDAMAGWQFHPHWSAALNVRNLFDEQYYESVRPGFIGLIQGEPRSLALTLRGTF